MSRTTSTRDSPEFLTATEVARWLRVPKSTLYKLFEEGQIPVAKIGRHWRFEKSALESVDQKPHEREWQGAQMTRDIVIRHPSRHSTRRS